MVCKLKSRSNLLMICRMLKNKGITKRFGILSSWQSTRIVHLQAAGRVSLKIFTIAIDTGWKPEPSGWIPLSQSLPSALSVPLPRPYSRIHDYWQNSSSVFSRPNVNANNSRFDKSDTCLCLDCFQQFKKSVSMITSTFIAHAMYRLT